MFSKYKTRNHQRKNYKPRCQGITLIEVLLVVGVLIILVSFASPSISGATSRTEMRAAAENVEYSIRIARNTARTTESDVWMNILTDQETEQSRITFTVSDKARKALGQPGLQEYQLDAGLIVVSDHPSYEFNSKGVVTNPGQIILVSRDDETLTTNFALE